MLGSCLEPTKMTTETKLRDFSMTGGEFIVDDQVFNFFNEYGYVLVRGLLDSFEISRLKESFETDPEREKKCFERDDGTGKMAKYFCWNHVTNDVPSMVARSEKVVGTFEKLLGGELYHYHSKLIQKEPKSSLSSGAHVWHQDYGYWYYNGLLKPDAGSVFIAVDKATKENGCLQIIEKSQVCGRVDHISIGSQIMADPARVKDLLQSSEFPLAYAEMDSGDALFFHGNVLHKSNPNMSDLRRWAFIIGYNMTSNNPVKKHHHPFYTKLHKVPNSAIRECTVLHDSKEKDFFDGDGTETKGLENVKDKKK